MHTTKDMLDLLDAVDNMLLSIDMQTGSEPPSVTYERIRAEHGNSMAYAWLKLFKAKEAHLRAAHEKNQ